MEVRAGERDGGKNRPPASWAAGTSPAQGQVGEKEEALSPRREADRAPRSSAQSLRHKLSAFCGLCCPPEVFAGNSGLLTSTPWGGAALQLVPARQGSDPGPGFPWGLRAHLMGHPLRWPEYPSSSPLFLSFPKYAQNSRNREMCDHRNWKSHLSSPSQKVDSVTRGHDLPFYQAADPVFRGPPCLWVYLLVFQSCFPRGVFSFNLLKNLACCICWGGVIPVAT